MTNAQRTGDHIVGCEHGVSTKVTAVDGVVGLRVTHGREPIASQFFPEMEDADLMQAQAKAFLDDCHDPRTVTPSVSLPDVAEVDESRLADLKRIEIELVHDPIRHGSLVNLEDLK